MLSPKPFWGVHMITDDDTYQMIVSWYHDESLEKPTNSNTDWFFSSGTGVYYVANAWDSIIWRYVDGHFQMVSYLEI